MSRWFDDGVRVALSVSESGDFVSLGTRNEFPFVSGGTYGVPLGWSPNFSAAFSPLSDYLNITVANGRFSVSNKHATNANVGNYFGITRDFPVTAGKRYVLWIQSRSMENKAGVRWTASYSFNGGNSYPMQGQSAQDWEQLAMYMLPPVNTTFIRVFLYGEYFVPAGQSTRLDWGLQWQLPALVEYDSSYPEPVFRDVTCDVQSLSIAYGRSKFTGRFDVATADIGVTNIDGDYTYQPVHPWGLRPGRFIKVTIKPPNSDSYYPAFYGLIDSISDSFPIDGKVNASISCIDTSSLLANTTVPTAQSSTTTSLSGLRFRHVLDTIAWNPSKRAYDDGVYYQQAVRQNGRTIRDELGIIADSEGAFFWCDREGILTFSDRTYLDDAPKANTVYAELMAECSVWQTPMIFRFPGVASNGLYINYDSTLSFSSTVNVEALVSFDNISRTTDIASQDSVWAFRKTATKTLLFNNGVGYAESSAPLPFNSGDTFYVKAVYDRAATRVTFSYAALGASYFTQLGLVMSLSSTMPSTANRAVRIGGNGATYTNSHLGTVHSVRLRNGTAIVTDFNADMWPGQAGATQLQIPAGQTIWVDQTGTNQILQSDLKSDPTNLVPVDGIPTVSSPTIVDLKSLQTDWSRDRVINDVQIANVGGSATQSVDAASQKKFGPRTYQRLDFINDNNHPEYNIERTSDYLNGWTDSILRVNSVTYLPTDDNYNWSLTMWLLDLVRIRYTHPTEGWGFAVATHIQGYVHNLTNGGWQTTLNLDQPESFVFWDRPPSGGVGWDTDLWDVGIWDNDSAKKAYWSSGQTWSDFGTKWS